MYNILKFRDYSIALKIGLWGAVLLLLLFIMVMVNSKQFRTMGSEFEVLKKEVIPTILTIEKLDSLVYQQTINRDKLIHIQLESSQNISDLPEDRVSVINQLETVSAQLSAAHLTANELIQHFARLEMRATKARWIRLQDQHQEKLQVSLDEIGSKIQKQDELTKEYLKSRENSSVEEIKSLQTQFQTIDQALHEALELLRKAATNGISTSEKKLHHMEYGARQLAIFLLFWFNLIGVILGYFIIRSIVRRIKSTTDFAVSIAGGGSCKPAEIKNQDELGQLMQAMNKIANSNAANK